MTYTSPSGRSIEAVLVLVSLAAMAMACTKPLVDPRPIAAATSPTQTRAAILRALAEGNYILESDRQGEIVAR